MENEILDPSVEAVPTEQPAEGAVSPSEVAPENAEVSESASETPANEEVPAAPVE